MRQRVYLQQQGQSEVRLFRFGEWIESELDGRKFQFRLRSCQTPQGQRLLLRFRDSSICQQALLRLENHQILFKSSYTVAAQRYEPRRTAIEGLGVQEGDLLIGSDVWSVDLLVSDRFVRSIAAILRWEPDGLHAIVCPGSRIATLGDTEESLGSTPGSLRLLAQEPRREGFCVLFFVDDVLFELSNSHLGDERAHLRLSAVGYLLAPEISRITLGPSEDCLVRLYGAQRTRRDQDEVSWNLWFEAVRCRAAPGSVVSAVTEEPGEISGAESFLHLLASYLPRPAEVPVEPSHALVDRKFVQQKAEEVLALVADRPDFAEPARRLRSLLEQNSYHEASLLAEGLRQQAQARSQPTAQPLEHGQAFAALGTEFIFLERSRLPGQRLPSLTDAPGLLLMQTPWELARLRWGGAGLELHQPLDQGAGSSWRSLAELRIGRGDAEAPEPDKIELPGTNLAVSSQAARLFVEAEQLWAAPWRRDMGEGDQVLVNFQVALEDPGDRAALEPGDWLVLGNLLLDLDGTSSEAVLRLRGVLLESALQEFGFALALGLKKPAQEPGQGQGAEPRLRFQGGARLLDATEPDGSARFGPYRFSCSARPSAARLLVESSGEGLARIGRSEGGMLAYSLRRRMTRLRQAPLYPVAPELFVGLNWQAEQPGVGIEIEAPFAEPSFFRLFQMGGESGAFGCQASPERSLDSGARHLRDGLPAPDERLLPGDELDCPPVRFRILEVAGAPGLDLQIELGAIELGGARGGSLAGTDAEIPEDEPWALRLPHPFPRLQRLRWSSQGQFSLEGTRVETAGELPSVCPRYLPRFSVYSGASLSRQGLRIGGPGAPAEIVDERLPAGKIVGSLEPSAEGLRVVPIEAGWWARQGLERQALPREGQLLEPGDRIGWDETEIQYDGTWD